jgi:hypothetical protein
MYNVMYTVYPSQHYLSCLVLLTPLSSTVPEFHNERWGVLVTSFSINCPHWLYSAVTGSIGGARGGVGGGVGSWIWALNRFRWLWWCWAGDINIQESYYMYMCTCICMYSSTLCIYMYIIIHVPYHHKYKWQPHVHVQGIKLSVAPVYRYENHQIAILHVYYFCICM